MRNTVKNKRRHPIRDFQYRLPHIQTFSIRRFFADHFQHGQPKCVNIYCLVILLVKQFWCHELRSSKHRTCFVAFSAPLTKSQVTNLNVSSLINKNVVTFQIAVDYWWFHAVHVFQAFQNLTAPLSHNSQTNGLDLGGKIFQRPLR